MRMRIRNAKLSDINAIFEIEKESFSENEAATFISFEKRLHVFNSNFWVLEVDHKIVGFVNGMVTNSETICDEMFENAELHDGKGSWQTIFGIAVAPAYRSNGFAGKLLKHITEESKKQNRTGITLTCKEHLLGYYEKFGFVNAGISGSKHGGEQWYDMKLTL